MVEALLRRERRVVAAALLVLVVLAWAYVVQGAGMGMSAWQMTSLSLFPHRQAEVPGEMPVAWPILIAMWWVMMIGMMTPSAAPLVLLYVRVLRAHSPDLATWPTRHSRDAPEGRSTSTRLKDPTGSCPT